MSVADPKRQAHVVRTTSCPRCGQPMRATSRRCQACRRKDLERRYAAAVAQRERSSKE